MVESTLFLHISDGECEYEANEWGACHAEILIRERLDPLVTASSAKSCKQINKIEKVCGPEGMPDFLISSLHNDSLIEYYNDTI